MVIVIYVIIIMNVLQQEPLCAMYVVTHYCYYEREKVRTLKLHGALVALANAQCLLRLDSTLWCSYLLTSAYVMT